MTSIQAMNTLGPAGVITADTELEGGGRGPGKAGGGGGEQGKGGGVKGGGGYAEERMQGEDVG